MSEDHQINPEPATEEAAPVKRSFDKGFKRNVLILGGVFGAAIIVVIFIVVGANKKNSNNGAQGGSTIPVPVITAGATPTAMTQSEEQRLGRVQGKESDAAREVGNTYIPKELPVNLQSLGAPDIKTNGPGPGAYSPQPMPSGQQDQKSAADSQREGMIAQGLARQLSAILTHGEPPPIQSAGPYANAATAAASAAVATVASNAASAASAPATLPEDLIKGMTIAGARLASPLDTAKTDFASAEITSGPLAGAYLIGKGRMVGEDGVQIVFNRMKFKDQMYAVNVTALDNSTSSEAMGADIDRKTLSRYVMPIIFSTAQAYLLAVARPAQTAIATAGVAVTVATPGATAREAAAAGIAAGMAKAAEGLSQSKPSAYMPIDTSIALLFNESVLKRTTK